MNTTLEQPVKRDSGNYDLLLERAQELETWCGVDFYNISANYDRRDHTLTIFCEFRPTQGPKLKANLFVNVVLYDQDNRIIMQKSESVEHKNFFGFRIAKIDFYYLTTKKMANIGKIKVYPSR